MNEDKGLFIGPQEVVVGYSKAPEQPYMSFSRYDKDGARTSHHMHCCIWSSPRYALRHGRRSDILCLTASLTVKNILSSQVVSLPFQSVCAAMDTLIDQDV